MAGCRGGDGLGTATAELPFMRVLVAILVLVLALVGQMLMVAALMLLT